MNISYTCAVRIARLTAYKTSRMIYPPPKLYLQRKIKLDLRANSIGRDTVCIEHNNRSLHSQLLRGLHGALVRL